MSEQYWTYQEKEDKWWAFRPKEEMSFAEVVEQGKKHALMQWSGRAIEAGLDEGNFVYLLRSSVVGLAHTAELALRRAEQATRQPRISAERMYQQSFVEVGYHLGPLAVVAYTAANDFQPNEWVIEGCIGEEVLPSSVHHLKMDYPTVWGIDISDQAKLSSKIDTWFPQ
ncbi:MAG: hypothetical protein QG629_758 [Patescibacteria group bacterium]|nr:hypothetical protein [Candidatus Saccharibacteria bacterium]MDQ5963675.1 hypothetical protein [Patescibacteria group bacterium]